MSNCRNEIAPQKLQQGYTRHHWGLQRLITCWLPGFGPDHGFEHCLIKKCQPIEWLQPTDGFLEETRFTPKITKASLNCIAIVVSLRFRYLQMPARIPSRISNCIAAKPLLKHDRHCAFSFRRCFTKLRGINTSAAKPCRDVDLGAFRRKGRGQVVYTYPWLMT